MTAGPAAAAPRTARKTWLMFIVATVFGAVLVSPYLVPDIDNSRLDVSGEAHYALLVAHVFTALIALVLGPSNSSRPSGHAGGSGVEEQRSEEWR